MNVVILAGGVGSRLSEQTEVKPKPMIEIGGRPVLWHIMKHYAHYGFKEFYIALGYKGEAIKRYFLDYYGLNGSMTLHLATGEVETHSRECEDWVVHLIDTGQETNTGGRVKRMEKWLQEDTFMVTYGDGVSNVNLAALLEFHRNHGKLATVSAVRPPARFGGLVFDDDLLTDFIEKPQTGEGWINGGFLVFEPGIFDYLEGEESSLEGDALERVAADRELVAYPHNDFWQCMDTVRDVKLLEALWNEQHAPWKVWN